jgi:hypothetical protein
VTESIQSIRTWRRDPDSDAGDPDAGPPIDPSSTARAARAAADARYQAFVSSGTSGPSPEQCRDVEAPDHDYDHCVNDPVSNPVLFQKQSTDADAVDSKDVRQGGLGDCHIMASLAALANTPAGRALIRSAVVENKNDGGEVVSWTVTLHQPEKHLLGETTFRDVRVTVDGLYVVGHARARAENGRNEIWPLVVEKAFARYAGGYNRIGRGGAPTAAMALLTGREATSVSLDWHNRWFRSYGAGELQADLASGKLVVLNTRSGIGGRTSADATPAERQANVDAHRLLPDHAYFATGLEQHDGKLFVKLGNPWAEAEPGLVPCDELTRWFSAVAIGSVP